MLQFYILMLPQCTCCHALQTGQTWAVRSSSAAHRSSATPRAEAARTAAGPTAPCASGWALPLSGHAC